MCLVCLVVILWIAPLSRRTAGGLTDAGKTRVGLYRLEKGKLIICWRRDSAGKLEWPSSLDPFHKDVWIEVFTLVKP